MPFLTARSEGAGRVNISCSRAHAIVAARTANGGLEFIGGSVSGSRRGCFGIVDVHPTAPRCATYYFVTPYTCGLRHHGHCFNTGHPRRARRSARRRHSLA